MSAALNQEVNTAAYQINIERVVLSSVFFDYEVMEILNESLKPEMFYMPAHQNIFQVFLDLYRENMPIDESFVRARVSQKDVDDNLLIEILSTSPIANVAAYVENLIENFTRREIEKLSGFVKKALHEDCLDSSSIMDLLAQQISNIEKHDVKGNDIKTLGEWDAEFDREPELEVLPSGIHWIDSTLDGGFKCGNFVFGSGKKETGKTYLFTTIMENMASCKTKNYPDGIKCGFFSMEFGTKHYRDAVKEKYPHKDNKKRVAIYKNVFVEHRVNDISEIEKKVKRMVKKGVKFIFIDSQLRVTNAGKDQATKAEKLADSFSRIGMMAQKYEIVIAMIVQTSKADHDADEVSVKGCIDADHEASLWLHIKKQKDSELRDMVFAKNKQNYKRPNVVVKFNPITHEFKKVNDVTKEGIPINYEDMQPQVVEYGNDPVLPKDQSGDYEIPGNLL